MKVTLMRVTLVVAAILIGVDLGQYAAARWVVPNLPTGGTQ